MLISLTASNRDNFLTASNRDDSFLNFRSSDYIWGENSFDLSILTYRNILSLLMLIK